MKLSTLRNKIRKELKREIKDEDIPKMVNDYFNTPMDKTYNKTIKENNTKKHVKKFIKGLDGQVGKPPKNKTYEGITAASAIDVLMPRARTWSEIQRSEKFVECDKTLLKFRKAHKKLIKKWEKYLDKINSVIEK